MWSLLQSLLPGILVAAAITAAVLAVAGRMQSSRRWAGAVALSAGYASGHAVAIGRCPAFPPSDSVHWLFYFALGATIIALLEILLGRTARWLPLTSFAIFSALCFGVLLQPKFRYAWSLAEGSLWLAGIVAMALFLAWCLETVARRSSAGLTLPLILAIVTAGTSAGLMLSGSILLAQFGMILEASLVVALGMAYWIPSLSSGRSVIPVVITLLIGLLLCGVFYAELPLISASIFAAAPVAALIPLGKRTSSKRTFWLQAGFVALVVATAVGIALHASPPLEY